LDLPDFWEFARGISAEKFFFTTGCGTANAKESVGQRLGSISKL
jgi:hypothetical protein